jgi:anti-anti-sigma factor
MFDRARGWDSRLAGPETGGGQSWNGAGWNGAGWNEPGSSGAGPHGNGSDGAGLDGNAVAAAAMAETTELAPVALGLTHRIYPDGHAVAVIRGELDAATADQAFEYVRRVIDRSHGPVGIDLAGLTFCDARGLRTLVGVAVHARKAGRRLSLVAPRPGIVKIMRITGADANFPELSQPGSHVTRP